MSDDDRSSRIIYLLAGLTLGAIGAILLAPCSGEETREFLAETAQDGMLCAKESALELREQFRGSMNSAEDAVRKFKERVETNVEVARERMNEAVRAGRTAYQDELSARQAKLDRQSS